VSSTRIPGKRRARHSLAEVLLPPFGVELPACDGQARAVGEGDVVTAGPVVGGRAPAAPLGVGDGEGEGASGFEVLGDGGEQKLRGDEADRSEDGVDRVEVLVGGLQVVQGVPGDEGQVVQSAVVRAGSADLQSDEVDAGDLGAVASGEVGGVVAGAAAEFQQSLAAQIRSGDFGAGAASGPRGPFHPRGTDRGSAGLTVVRWSAWTYQGDAWASTSDLQEMEDVGEVAAYGLDVGGVGGRVVDPADRLLHEPLDGPDAMPAQRPLLRRKPATLGEGVSGAALGDVRLREDAQRGSCRRVVPGRAGQ
jgi:hypothetical protein